MSQKVGSFGEGDYQEERQRIPSPKRRLLYSPKSGKTGSELGKGLWKNHR